MNERQKSRVFGQDSMSSAIENPVPVHADMDSNAASINGIPVKRNGSDPQNDHRAQFYVDETSGNRHVRLFNHNTPIMALPGVNNRDGRVTISQDDPYPFSLLSYEIDFEPETGGYR